MNFRKFIQDNLLLKVTSTNTVVVFIRMFFSLISQKALAIFIGAEGIAQVGNFKNVFNFFEQFSILGTFNGLVKYISELKNNKEELNKLISTTVVFTFAASIISFLILFFGANYFNELIFGSDRNYSFVFKMLAILFPLMGINAIFNGLLNGLSAYKTYSKVVIFTVILSTSLLVFFTFKSNVKGSLLAISLIPLIQFIGYLFFLSKKHYKYFKGLSFSLIYKNKLLSYSLMTIVVVLLFNWVEVEVRNLIHDSVGAKDAGYWTAMTSISKTYMQFSAAIFPLYILPKYAKMTSSIEFRNEVLQTSKLLLPVFAVGMFLIFLFKNIFIQLLFTNDFLAMSNLFKWQLLGDLVKLSALIISYLFLAKGQIVYFIFTEVLSIILFLVFSKYFIQDYGTEGVVMAHFYRYIVYLIVVLIILRRNLFGKERVI